MNKREYVHKWSLIAIVLVVVLAWMTSSVQAASLGVNSADMAYDRLPNVPQLVGQTFYVNTIADTVDNNIGNGLCVDVHGLCSLRAAIQESNFTAAQDSIIINDLVTDQFAVLNLPAIIYPVTIQGQGRDVTIIKANGVNAPYGFDMKANVTLSKLAVRGFITGIIVDKAALTITINNTRLNQNGTALRVTKASTVEISQSYINANTATALFISGGGTVNLSNSHVNDNTSPMNGAAATVNLDATLFAVDSTFINNTSTENGGAIYNKDGVVELWHVDVSGNTAGNRGGGIFQESSGYIFIKGDSHIQTNQSDYGGGIYIDGGRLDTSPLSANWPEISGNTALTSGGGLYLSNGSGTLDQTLIDGNTAPQSGGILHDVNFLLTIRDSAITNNTATAGDVGGLYFFGSGSELRIVNSTISGNQSTRNGGGIYFAGGTVYLSNVTISNNTCNSDQTGGGQGGGIYRKAGAVWMQNSIVAGNHDKLDNAFDTYFPDIFGSVGSRGYNLIGRCPSPLCAITGDTAGNQVGVADPGLDALTYDAFAPRPYSPYHPLLASSPAVDGGNPAGCRDSKNVLITIDQIGWQRTFGSACDIGAVESPFQARFYIYLPLVLR